MPISRRDLLRSASGALVAASLWPFGARADQPRELMELAAGPQQLETPLSAFDRLIIPTDELFVRSHFGPPRLDPSRSIRVDGLVRKPLDLRPESLARYSSHDVTAVIQCAGNGRRFSEPRVSGVQWGHGAMGQGRWRGVRLADVLQDAGLQDGAAHVGLLGADRPPLPTVPAFHRSIPLARALMPDTLIAIELNGRPLDLNHGAPARLVVPGWAADHWVKWLTHIEILAEPVGGYFMDTAYRLPVEPVPPGTSTKGIATEPVHEFPVKSVIAGPAEGDVRERGVQEVIGVAFSGYAPIERVEVSFDGGQRWERAKLEGEPGFGRWQVFRARKKIGSAGTVTATVRAFDRAGNTQPEHAIWNPSGYFQNAWHRVAWSVA